MREPVTTISSAPAAGASVGALICALAGIAAVAAMIASMAAPENSLNFNLCIEYVPYSRSKASSLLSSGIETKLYIGDKCREATLGRIRTEYRFINRNIGDVW